MATKSEKKQNAEKANSGKPPTDARSNVTPKQLEASQQNPMATIDNDDERLLARIGYRQVRASLRCITLWKMKSVNWLVSWKKLT